MHETKIAYSFLNMPNMMLAFIHYKEIFDLSGNNNEILLTTHTGRLI